MANRLKPLNHPTISKPTTTQPQVIGGLERWAEKRTEIE